MRNLRPLVWSRFRQDQNFCGRLKLDSTRGCYSRGNYSGSAALLCNPQVANSFYLFFLCFFPLSFRPQVCAPPFFWTVSRQHLLHKDKKTLDLPSLSPQTLAVALFCLDFELNGAHVSLFSFVCEVTAPLSYSSSLQPFCLLFLDI